MDCWVILWICFIFFVNFFGLWSQNSVFLSFCRQSHAESSRNFFKKSVLDPKRGRLDQNSDFGHVLCVFRPDSGGRPQSEFGRIRTAVPNLSSAGFGRTGGFGRIRADGGECKGSRRHLNCSGGGLTRYRLKTKLNLHNTMRDIPDTRLPN